MNRDQFLNYKSLFEIERDKLLLSNRLFNEQYHLPKEDLLDDVDMTTSELETSMRMRLRNRETLFLKKIGEALKRIDEGTFGECTSCADPIEPKRLEARPTTTMCVHCKEEEERKEHIHIDGHRSKSLGNKLKLA